MVTVWLYATDGRALYYVTVPTPMPPYVTFGGRTFAWNGEHQRYEAIPIVEARADDDTGKPRAAAPMSPFELRQHILDGIDRMLARPIILGLTADDKMILKAQRDFWSTNDSAVQALLTKLGWQR